MIEDNNIASKSEIAAFEIVFTHNYPKSLETLFLYFNIQESDHGNVQRICLLSTIQEAARKKLNRKARP